MRPNLEGLSSSEAVRRILEHTGQTMRPRDIERWPEDDGRKPFTPGQVAGALRTLVQKKLVEKVNKRYRIASMREPTDAHRAGVLDVTGLTSKETVFEVLAHTKKPMKHGDIMACLEDNDQEPLRYNQIAGALYDLLNNYWNVVQRVGDGTYCVHEEWDGKSLDNQKRQAGWSVPRSTSKEPKPRVVIPCFGLHWERSSVSWNTGRSPNLLGKQNDGDDAVNFANQTGIYILYQWPQVNYVGRTANGGLYQRLSSHHADPSKGLWDRFSWFGLNSVDEDGRLRERRGQMSVADEVTMMEALLISVLTPPRNKRGGDGMGVQYLQVPDPMVEEREQKALAEKLIRMLAQR